MAHVVALDDYWWQWGNLLFRWLHVIAAIAWIGGSFYFIALDNHLEPPPDPRDAARGIGGEAWEVHGGGFYRVEKFRVAPARLPERLHWFKWEAYTTWLSGFALFVVVYFVHPQAFLVDPSVADLSSWAAIVIAVGGLVLAWVVYDAVCRAFGTNERLIAVCIAAGVVVRALLARGARRSRLAADRRMRVEQLLLLVLRQLARHGPCPSQRILDGCEALHEPRASLEQLRQLLGRQLPR